MGLLLFIALLALAFFAGRWFAESRLSSSGISEAVVGEVAQTVRTEYPEVGFALDTVQSSINRGARLSPDEVLAELRRLYPRQFVSGE
jgi:DNA topoisomerase IA